MEFNEFIIIFISIISAIFGYHKYIIQYTNQKNKELHKRLDKLEHYIDSRDNEIKALIRELKQDIHNSISSLKDDLKHDMHCKRRRK